MSLNKTIIQGNVCQDIELQQTSSNVSTCRFTVACERNFVPKGEERQADFIAVTAWRQTAEFISKYFSKGNMIVVEGNLHTGSYQDKKYPDVKHYTMEVYADQVYFGESKAKNDGNQQTSQAQTSQQNDNSASLAVGDLSEFEEILGDGQLPF